MFMAIFGSRIQLRGAFLPVSISASSTRATPLDRSDVISLTTVVEWPSIKWFDTQREKTLI